MLAALPALAACDSAGGASAAPSASATLTDAQIQPVINQLVQCIRENGAPGMPDVRVENGKVVGPDENSVDEATKQAFETAYQSPACQAIKNKLPPSVFGEGGQDEQQQRADQGLPTAEDVPALRKFAQCMRDNGIPEWPDPNADGTFTMHGTQLETEGKSPRIIAAAQACEKYWSGGITAR
jgi:hypothetical protein